MHLFMYLWINCTFQLSQGGQRVPPARPREGHCLPGSGFLRIVMLTSRGLGKGKMRLGGYSSWHRLQEVLQEYLAAVVTFLMKTNGIIFTFWEHVAHRPDLRGRNTTGRPRVWWPDLGSNPNHAIYWLHDNGKLFSMSMSHSPLLGSRDNAGTYLIASAE